MKVIDLYLKDLVPMAQLLMLLGELYPTLTRHNMKLMHKRALANGTKLDRDEVRAALLGEGFNTLNLVNCEVQSWTASTTGKAERTLALSTALQPMKAKLRDEVTTWQRLTGATMPALVKHGLTRASLSLKRDFSGERIVDSLVTLLNSWGDALRCVHNALDYAPERRQAWLDVRTRRSTPLMRDGRTGTWRTLPKNLDWRETLQLLKVAATESKVTASTVFGSPIGKARLAELLQTAFPSHAEEVSPPAAQTAETDEPLPDGIDVRRTPQGLLAVTAKVARMARPKGDADLLRFLQSNAEFKPLLSSRESELTCGPSRLVEVLAQAGAWLKEQELLAERAAAAYAEHRQGLVRQRALERLKDFNAEELAVLAEHFRALPTPPETQE